MPVRSPTPTPAPRRSSWTATGLSSSPRRPWSCSARCWESRSGARAAATAVPVAVSAPAGASAGRTGSWARPTTERRGRDETPPGPHQRTPVPSGGRGMSRLPRTETLLVLACAASAAVLGASEFMTLFEFTPPGGEAIESLSAGDQHGYAQLVLAGMAVALLAVAIATPRPAD